MNDSTKEAVGFMCRWTLLALTSALAVGAAAIGVRVSAAVIQAPPAELTVGDAIGQSVSELYIKGYLLSAGWANSAVVISQPVSNDLAMVTGTRRIMWLQIENLSRGPNAFAVLGIPYGPLALYRQDVQVFNVSAETRVILIDLNWARQLGLDRKATLYDTCRRLAESAQIGFFLAASASEYEQLRQQLRQVLPMAAVIYAPMTEGLTAPLRYASRTMRRWNHNNQILVVTGDRALAEAAAADRFRVVLVGTDAGASDNEYVRSCDLLENLPEYCR